MLRMNTRKALENAKKEALSYYEETEKAGILADMESTGREGEPAYRKGLELAESGCFAVYYCDQRKALAEMLEESEEEANRFSDIKVFKTYCHLMGKACESLAKEG